MTVHAAEEECLTVRTPKNEQAYINGNFDALDDMDEPIMVALFDETYEEVWTSKKDSTEGTFSYLGTGVHYFCLHNTSEEHDRQVGFSIRVVPSLQIGTDAEANTPGDEIPQELMSLSGSLNNWIANLLDHQEYMKVREASYRDMAEATFTRVFHWTLFEALILISVIGGQVMYLKKLIERKSYR